MPLCSAWNVSRWLYGVASPGEMGGPDVPQAQIPKASSRPKTRGENGVPETQLTCTKLDRKDTTLK